MENRKTTAACQLRWAALLLSCCALGPASLAGAPPDRIAPSHLLSQSITLNLPATTLLDALFQFGRASNSCFGIVVLNRSIALAKTPSINAKGMKPGDMLATLLAGIKGFSFHEADRCVIVEPVRNRPAYLAKTVPLFRIPRSVLEMASYDLYLGLLATEIHPPKGGLGMISSIGSNTDSPHMGPIELKGRSIKALLCEVAREAGGTMWIGLPRTEGKSSDPGVLCATPGPTRRSGRNLG